MNKQIKLGRPAIDSNLKKAPFCVKLPKHIIDWLRSQPESSAILIERALNNTYDINISKPVYPLDDPL